MKLKTIISILSLLLLPSFSTTYYVSNNGNDNNSGTKQNPWQTLERVNNALENEIEIGDKVFFHKNHTFQGTLRIENFNQDGLNQNYTHFSSYGSSYPRINKNNAVISISIEPNSLEELHNWDEETPSTALSIEDAQYININNLEFRGIWAAVRIGQNSSNIKLQKLIVGKDSLNGIIIEAHENIIINKCKIINKFTNFSRPRNENEVYKTEDGILIYSLINGQIRNNNFKNWGHASINIDADSHDGSISYNKVYNNYLSSPDIAYGGRIVVDEAHHNEIYNNKIINTSIESQLNGHHNEYYDNIFKGTQLPKNNSDHAAILIQAYNSQNIHNNIYKGNQISNVKNGVGLKISGNNEHSIVNNYFINNIISNCSGNYNQSTDTYDNIQLEVEEKDIHSTGEVRNNNYQENLIDIQKNKQVILYHSVLMQVSNFNNINYENSYDDGMQNNSELYKILIKSK